MLSMCCLVLQAHRMTATKKRLELLQLASGVHALKSAFNGRFAALRSLKLSIIDEVNKLYARLREVNSQLGIHGAWCMDSAFASGQMPLRTSIRYQIHVSACSMRCSSSRLVLMLMCSQHVA